MRNLWLKILHTGGATLYASVASAVGLAITTRYLGPSGRGVYAAAIAWVTLVAVFGSLSLGPVIVHQVSGRPRSEWLGVTTGTVAAILAAVTLLAWAGAAVAFVVTRGRLFSNLSPGHLVIAFAALPFLLGSDAARFILNALDRLAVANWAQISGTTAGLAGVGILVVLLGGGVRGALVAWAIGSAAVMLVMAVALLREGGDFAIRRDTAVRLLGGSGRLHMTAIGNYLFSQASVLVLNYYRPPSETGFYQLTMQLFGFALLVSSAIGTVSFGLVAQKGANGAWPEQRHLIGQSLAVVSVIAVLGYVLAPLGIRIVAGSGFLPAVPLFRTVLPALIGSTFSTVMASQWIGRGLFWQASVLTVAVGLISLASDLILIPRHGMYGALVSTLITYGTSVIGNGTMAIWVQRQWRRSLVAAPG